MNFIAIDFETANAQRTSACSLGLAFVKDGVVTDCKEYLIKPYPFEFHPFQVGIHGITENDVMNAPAFDELWGAIAPMLENNMLVAHNAAFDVSVLRNSLLHYGLRIPTSEFFCTYRLSRNAFPNSGSHRLNVISKLCGVELEHHNAKSDAKACAEVLCHLADKNGFSSIDEMEEHFQLKRGFFNDNDYTPCRSLIYCDPTSTHKSAKEFLDVSDVCRDDDFMGKYFCFTGTLLSMTRTKAYEIVATGGGTPQDRITMQTNVLVVGLQEYHNLNGAMSGKMQKAYKYKENGQDIQVVVEDDFLAMIDDDLYKKCGMDELLTV